VVAWHLTGKSKLVILALYWQMKNKEPAVTRKLTLLRALVPNLDRELEATVTEPIREIFSFNVLEF